MAGSKAEPVVVSESSVGRLCVYWEEYRTKMYLHIRYWYLDKSDGQWKPGAKGVAIPQANVGNLLAGVKSVLEGGNV